MKALIAAVLAAMLAACAQPQTAPRGPALHAPALTQDDFVMADGARLFVRQWTPESQAPKAIVLALHGFNDHSRSWELPAESWAKAGIATYAYDQRGFGRTATPGIWPGTAALIADLGEALELVAARHPRIPVFVAGESMGGAVIMAAHRAGALTRARGAILGAPAVRGRAALSPWSRAWLWLLAHSVPGWAPTVEGTGIRPSDNIPMLRELGRDPLVIKRTRVDALYGLVDLMDAAAEAAPGFDPPALFLIGANDNLVPGTAMRAMLDRLPPAPPAERALETYGGGYHMLFRDLARAKVHDDVARWVLDRTDPR
ncbi:MAG: alpha/beta hydrolase [Azospirillum sp.]|nr:alpha/beta hydrolase [Azospirillum sp.]